MKLTFKNLSKAYSKVTVLNDIAISLENVNSVGIIGESGCGKSTLLRLLSGIEMPDSGEITVNDLSPISQTEDFQENIGVVFQNHCLFPHLTVQKNITLLLHKIKKWNYKKALDTTTTLLKRLHIEQVAHKKPHEISGGQAQRASIARALASNPSLFFLDEPTAALDPLMTDEVLKAISNLKADGRSFIFVTHEINFLKQFADYVIFLKDGNIHEHGSIDCLTNPKTRELSTFLKLHHDTKLNQPHKENDING